MTATDSVKDFAAAWRYFRDGRRLGILREVIRGQRMAASICRAEQPLEAADHSAAADYLASLLPAEVTP